MIAVLAYGSLVWDIECLAPHVVGAWHMRAGPVLPMEFSRISPKRRLGLVLCLDPEAGVSCATHAIRSARRHVETAASDLARRERAPLSRIGQVSLGSGLRRSRQPQMARIVADWCASSGWSGAVWTDLAPNFEPVTGTAFSVPSARAYLRSLGGDARDEAVRYISNAPAETDTPLRRALLAEPWWRAETRRLGLG